MSRQPTSIRSSEDAPPVITTDSHVHILPLKLAGKIRTFFEKTGFVTSKAIEVDSCCAADGKVSKAFLMYPVDPKLLVSVLVDEAEATQSSSAGRVWVLPYSARGNLSENLNQEVIELCRELSSDMITLVPGMTVHAGDDSTPEVVCEKAIRGGARICKLHCSVGNFSVLDERLRRFWMLAQALRLPVVIHAGASTKGTTDSSDLDAISTLCSQYPQAVIVLAHSGHPNTDRAFELTLQHDSLYLDTTPVILAMPDYPPPSFSPTSPFSTGDIPYSIHQHMILLAIKGRILFGTDSPTTAITRSDAASKVRDWIRSSTIKAMGSGKIEDIGGEMNRISNKAEKMVLGDAADLLESNLRTIEEAREELGWDLVKSKI